MTTRIGHRISYLAPGRHLRLLGALWLLLLQQPIHAAETLYFSGRAFDLDSGQIAYTEEHSYTPSGIYRVIYREPDGEAFATKTADFSISRFAPNLEQHNERIGEIVRITHRDADTLDAIYREANNKPAASSTIAASANTVIDAGFHPYILAHWDELLGGRIDRIDYVVPTWRRSVALTIKAEPRTADSRQCFVIKPASALIAMFADPIELTYDTQSRHLVEFRGTSNIAQRGGDYHRVRIEYDYPPLSTAANVHNGAE